VKRRRFRASRDAASDTGRWPFSWEVKAVRADGAPLDVEPPRVLR
jgi:hypothetical protein